MSYYSSNFFPNTSSYSFSICFSLFSFSFSCSVSLPLIVPLCLVLCLHPFISLLFFSAYSLNLSCLCPPPTIFCSRTVLHGQFTQSATHSPFSPQALNTIFKHKTPKVEKLKKESKTELERENKRPGRKKKELEVRGEKTLNPFFAAWPGVMEVCTATRRVICALLTWLDL